MYISGNSSLPSRHFKILTNIFFNFDQKFNFTSFTKCKTIENSSQSSNQLIALASYIYLFFLLQLLGANNNLSCASSTENFFSGSVSINCRAFITFNQPIFIILNPKFSQSSVAGIQEALSKLGLLGVIDDLESRPKVSVH